MIIDSFIGPAERQLELALEEARTKFASSGNKGGAVEESVRKLLRDTMPARLSVGQGEVLDKHGSRSSQLDVVIATDDHPKFLVPATYLIEGVAAVGEVKSILTTDELERALTGSRRFKRLKPESGEDEIMFGWLPDENPDERRYYISRPNFLLSLESQLSLDTVADRVQAAAGEAALSGERIFDAVFARGRGWVVDFGNGNGPFRRKDRDGAQLTGWVRQPTQFVVFQMLAWLSTVMPRPWLQRPVIAPYLQ